MPSVRSCQPLLLQVPFGVSDLAGVLPRLLEVSCTNHTVIDHVVIELAGVAHGVADQLDFGIQELVGPFSCGAEKRGCHCTDQAGTCPTRSQQQSEESHQT